MARKLQTSMHDFFKEKRPRLEESGDAESTNQTQIRRELNPEYDSDASIFSECNLDGNRSDEIDSEEAILDDQLKDGDSRVDLTQSELYTEYDSDDTISDECNSNDSRQEEFDPEDKMSEDEDNRVVEQSENMFVEFHDNNGENIRTYVNTEAESFNSLEDKYYGSIFRLDNKRFQDLDNVKSATELCNIVTDALKKNKRLKESKSDKIDKCGLFHLKHFFYLLEKEENYAASQITKQRGYRNKNRKFPGERRPGNILLFHRMKVISTKSVPEAYCLCDGVAFHAILHFCDPLFRTQVAKHFIDGQKIKELDTINIAGPDITIKTTYKGNSNIAAQTGAYLEKAIASVSGIIKSQSKLDELLQEDGREEMLITVGMNFVRICKRLPLDTWEKVLELFSDVIETDVDRSSCHLLNALEYVQRVEDDEKRRSLQETITELAIDIITYENTADDFYLSHRYIRDWCLASDVSLLQVINRNKEDELMSWCSAPTLDMVITAIHDNFSSEETIKRLLQEKKITLSYWRQGRKEKHPVQEFVHGNVSRDCGAYFKIGQKWFFLSSVFSQVVDRNFAFLSNSILIENDICKILKYPWCATKEGIKGIDSDDIKFFLGLPEDECEKLLEELTREMSLLDSNYRCCLTKYSCLLPKSSKLYQDITKRKTKEKEKKKPLKGNGGNSKILQFFTRNTSNDHPSITCSNAAITELPERNISDDMPSVASTSGIHSVVDERITDNGHRSVTALPSDGDGTCGVAPSPDIIPPITSLVNRLSNNSDASTDINNEPENEESLNIENVSKEERVDIKREKIGSLLLDLLQSGKVVKENHFRTILKRQGPVCVKKGDQYFVKNAILTTPFMTRLQRELPSLEEPQLLNLLRCKSQLTEGEYNELYLHCEEGDRFVVLPGDRILANNVELFDILIHDRETRVTYLIHNKLGLNHLTRDACAQIRNSSELLWYDFIRGQRNHIDMFWDSAVNSKTAKSPYRVLVREKLQALGRDTFVKMFDNAQKIVFVLAFVIPQDKGTPKLQFKFKALTLADFKQEKLYNCMEPLQKSGFLTQSGYLTDIFLGITQEKFLLKCQSVDGLKDLNKKKQKKLYTFLRKFGTCDLSTIAKLELLTLDGCFAKYQIGGSERRFQFRLFQLKSA